MVRTLQSAALSCLLALSQLTVAYIPLPAPAMITPFPRSPFDPGSPYYGVLQRDNKNGPSTTVLTIDASAGICGFTSGTALTCKVGEATCGQDNEQSVLGCCGDQGNCEPNTACWNSKDSATPGDRETQCNDAKNAWCVTMTSGAFSWFTCGTATSVVNIDNSAVSTISASTTSSSSASTSGSSSTTGTSTTTAASSTPTSSEPSGPTGLISWKIALIVIGSVLGAVALVFLIYHLVSSRVHPDEGGDEVPLIEGKTWRGPWQGR